MSAPFFSIKSSASDRELVFFATRPDYFTVELRGSDIRAVKEVYDARGLAELFAKLASFERPWKRSETWESLEGEFGITAACSTLGEVRFCIRVRDVLAEPEPWEVSACVVSELGQLPDIAMHAKVFFRCRACG
jgi:hypothetical protein